MLSISCCSLQEDTARSHIESLTDRPHDCVAPGLGGASGVENDFTSWFEVAGVDVTVHAGGV